MIPILVGLVLSSASSPDEISIRRIGPHDCVHADDDRPHLELYIFASISESDVERWSEFLQLSDAQAAFVGRAYNDYLGRDAHIRGELQPGLWEQTADFAAQTEFGPSLAQADAYDEILAVRQHLVERIVHGEDVFFESLIPGLTDEQLLRFERVKQRRRRYRCQLKYPFLPGSCCDLAMVVDALCYGPEPALAVRDGAGLDQALAEYGTAMTPLFERRDRDGWDTLRKIVRVQGEYHDRFAVGDEQATPGAAVEHANRVDVAGQALLRVVRRIQRLNDEYAVRIAEQFEPAEGVRFLDAYRREFYPVVYPNPHDARDILVAAMELDPASVQLAEIQRVDTFYREQDQRVGDRMVELYLLWQSNDYNWRAAAGTEYDHYRHSMVRLQNERAYYMQFVLDALASYVPVEEYRGLQTTIHEIQRSSDLFSETLGHADKGGDPWPPRH